MALAQAEEVERPLGAERVNGALGAALGIDITVAAGEAGELVLGVQAQHVGERPPLEDVRVDVDLVAGDVIARLAAVGKAHRRREALVARGLHDDPRGEVLPRQRAVALRADGDGAEKAAQREQRDGGEQSHGEAQHAHVEKRDQRGNEKERAERRKDERADGERRGRDAGRHPASLGDERLPRGA